MKQVTQREVDQTGVAQQLPRAAVADVVLIWEAENAV